MTIRPVRETPCWVLEHESDWDWRPHYATEHKANESLWDQRKEARDDELEPGDTMAEVRPDLVTSVARREPVACLELVCDGCGHALGMEGEMVDAGSGSHYLEIDEVMIRDEEWHRAGERHYCPACGLPADARDDLRTPGPYDEPLLGLGDNGQLEELA